jgi:hypothetical protein
MRKTTRDGKDFFPVEPRPVPEPRIRPKIKQVAVALIPPQ